MMRKYGKGLVTGLVCAFYLVLAAGSFDIEGFVSDLKTFAIIFVVVAVLAVLVGFHISGQYGRARAAASRAYQDALDELEASPTDGVAKRRALEQGRQLANLCRESGQATVFDEIALNNDIQVRSGALVQDVATASGVAMPGVSEKSCPDCAETVKAAARVCRYCGYRFELPPE